MPQRIRDPHGNAEAFAVDFDIELTLDLGLVVVSSFGAGCGHIGEIEDFFDPLRRVLVVAEVVMLEDGDVGRDGGGDALDTQLAECSEARLMATSASGPRR